MTKYEVDIYTKQKKTITIDIPATFDADCYIDDMVCSMENVNDIIDYDYAEIKPKPMKLWLVDRKDGCGYDEYDSAVVCAADVDSALALCSHSRQWNVNGSRKDEPWIGFAKENVTINELIPDNLGPMLVLASFNAG